MNNKHLVLAGCLAILGLLGCEEKAPEKAPAPSATTLADAKPAAAGAAEFTIQKDGSEVDFQMDAVNEKIRGKVHGATRGTIQVDLKDVTKTTAHLYVDIGELELYQQKRDGDEFGEEKKSDLQNEHARNWLEIGPCDDADDEAKCKEAVKKNRNVEFVITEVEAEKKDLTAMKGDTRTVQATVTGNFLLHQHVSTKTAKLEITVKMKGDEPTGLSVKTLEPFEVGLEAHDVRPRTAFGKLADKLLSDLTDKDKKVAKEAEVSVAFDATFSKMLAGGPKKMETDTKPVNAK